MQTLRPYYRNKLGVGLYVWRDLELSQMNRGERVIGWSLTHCVTKKNPYGSKNLRTGENNKVFYSEWEANEYLKKNYNLRIYGFD